MKPKHHNHQPTFDDLEPVLEPEQRERVLEPNQVKNSKSRSAIDLYSLYSEVRENLNDPLF